MMRIALVKPEKARQVEEMMLQMAKRGQIGERVRAPSLPLTGGPFPRGEILPLPFLRYRRVKIQGTR